MRSAGGWRVERVVIDGRELLRVTHPLGYHVASTTSVSEVREAMGDEEFATLAA